MSYKQVKVMVVPHWVQVSVKAGGGNLGYLMDPEKLLSILSKRDVGFYLESTRLFTEYLNKDVFESISTLSAVSASFIALSNDDYNKVILDLKLSLGSPSTPAEALAFINQQGVNGGDTIDTLQGLAMGFEVLGYEYDCFLLKPKAVCSKDLQQCYESLISVMHSVMPLHEIAALPIFSRYEKGLNTY